MNFIAKTKTLTQQSLSTCVISKRGVGFFTNGRRRCIFAVACPSPYANAVSKQRQSSTPVCSYRELERFHFSRSAIRRVFGLGFASHCDMFSLAIAGCGRKGGHGWARHIHRIFETKYFKRVIAA